MDSTVPWVGVLDGKKKEKSQVSAKIGPFVNELAHTSAATMMNYTLTPEAK